MHDDRRDLRVAEHILQAIDRVRGVQGQISRTGPQDAENTDHQLRRTNAAKSHQRTARDSRRAQPAADSVRLRKGFGVSDRDRSIGQRDAIGCKRRLPREPAPESIGRREIAHGSTPERQNGGPPR